MSITPILLVLTWFLAIESASAVSEALFNELRHETENLFYHGFDNYMAHAFPEDELKPLSCAPLSRDQADPSNIGLNDPLGNYSLTLVDSLSTLAILASSSQSAESRTRAFLTFQTGVEALVGEYGDGSSSSRGLGARARGFDLDSKVQVFETVIRGLGGLLSAHLFAIGELPINGYRPRWDSQNYSKTRQTIQWSEEFVYDGQLLRLAHDLGKRLLPAFSTSTGLPYPRVNLRHGIPFYHNAPSNCEAGTARGHSDGPRQCPIASESNELTETCSAGAGSLILELTVLGRLTGDSRFEEAGKRAFWSVWERRSEIGLIGSGIDAETGLWTSPYTGLGAGIDSFFEYAFKSYVLLSGSSMPDELGRSFQPSSTFDPPPLDAAHHDPRSFLRVWKESLAATRRHLYRGKNFVHPHYVQADLHTGAVRAFWMDSLSAFFPGLLAIAGETDEAMSIHLLFTALWTRYSAIPERWSTVTGKVEGGLGWWGGRPEFVESTYHLFKATEDPWYVHVGEMALRDIKRRCWTPCGWSGIQDVRTGERNDRQESFFLGETAKYLHLLFDPNHPINKLDAAFVFTTEGHPLLIPKSLQKSTSAEIPAAKAGDAKDLGQMSCPVRPSHLPLTVSRTANRPDIFHAANLARLDEIPTRKLRDSPLMRYGLDHPSITLSDLSSPSNFTYYPWTLPATYIPTNGICELMVAKPTFDITFPSLSNEAMRPGSLQRVGHGILVTGMGNLRLGMIQDTPDTRVDASLEEIYRVHSINTIPLGVDEKIYIPQDAVSGVVNPLDPNFTRVRHPVMLDVFVDIMEAPPQASFFNQTAEVLESLDPDLLAENALEHAILDDDDDDDEDGDAPSNVRNAFKYLSHHVSSILHDQAPLLSSTSSSSSSSRQLRRIKLAAITSTGLGAAPIPDFDEALGLDLRGNARGSLSWRSIAAVGHACRSVLHPRLPRTCNILIVRRGGCSFSDKLANIPSFPPSAAALQLVIVVSDPELDLHGGDDRAAAAAAAAALAEAEEALVRPLLEEVQRSPSGLRRHHPIPLVMVSGGDAVYEMLAAAEAVGIKRRYSVQAQGIPISNLIIV